MTAGGAAGAAARRVGGQSACPGCGAVLPRSDWIADRRVNASSACRERRAHVLAFEADHLATVGGLHQLTVDAYGAQHGGPDVPAIVVPFALLGLHLALDDGMAGVDVRAVHQRLAQRRRAPSPWPVFAPPAGPRWLTAADVAVASTPAEYRALATRWATSVWAAWSDEHEHVRAWARAVRGSAHG